MSDHLLHMVAQANMERIYGDRRFDFVDNDWIESVVRVAEGLPSIERESIAETTAACGIRNMVKHLREGRK